MRPAYLRTLARAMHTEGRRVPHPPLGGPGAKGPSGSISPTLHGPSDPAQATSSTSSVTGVNPPSPPLPPAATATSGASSYRTSTAMASVPEEIDIEEIKKNERIKDGKRVPVRPRRTIPVRMPGGYLEPPSWPPTKEWVEAQPEPSSADRHPLWNFFFETQEAKDKPTEETHLPPWQGSMTIMDKIGVEETLERGARAWNIAELRLKSFQDLHTLWWLCLRQVNALATQRSEKRRMNAAAGKWMGIRSRAVRTTMRNIKYVLNERRLGLIASVAPQLKRGPLPLRTDPINQRAALQADTWLPARLEDLKIDKQERGRKRGKAKLVARTRWSQEILRAGSGEGKIHHTAEEVYEALKLEDAERRAREEAERNGAVYEQAEESADAVADAGAAADAAAEATGEADSQKGESHSEADEAGVVGREQVAKEEVESRDEGFGGGKEAQEFVEHTQVDKEGKVHQK